MASSLIHIAVANELNKQLRKDYVKLMLGTIAPDISKELGESKTYTHFLGYDNPNVPILSKFLSIYKDYLYDDFVLGYYIHLYVDYLWFKYFIPEIYDSSKSLITKSDGTKVVCTGNMATLYIYNDYTNLNQKLLADYKLDLEFLYLDIPKINNIIMEAQVDKIDIIVKKCREIIEKSKVGKDMIFDMENVDNFISLSVRIISSNLMELGILY